MIPAVDQNGLPFDVEVQADGSLHDEYGYTYVRAEQHDDPDGLGFVDQDDANDVVLVPREDYGRALDEARP